jgi:hypothetical protein
MGWGSGTPDPGSEIRKKLIPDPDPGVKVAPDPTSGSATLLEVEGRLQSKIFQLSTGFSRSRGF